MIYKYLANTDEKISAIGMGTGDFNLYNVDDKILIYALQFGLDLGINFIDTAENYMNGHAEEIVAKAIKHKRKNVFISTKVSPEHLCFSNVFKSVERSLRKLNTDYIDLYQIHWPNPDIQLFNTLRAMEILQESGKIRFIGVSNFLIDEYKQAHYYLGNKLVSNQIEYNLCNRTAENDILPYSMMSNHTIIAYSPFKDYMNLDLLNPIASLYDKTIYQIILNWMNSKQNLISIMRSITPSHIKGNIESLNFSLLSKDIKKINQLYKNNIQQIDVNKVEINDKKIEDLYNKVKILSVHIQKGMPIKPIKVKYNNGKYKLL